MRDISNIKELEMESKTFGSRCLYAFMGFVSSALLSAAGLAAYNRYSRRDRLSSFTLISSGVFITIFTVWGFIDGEGMLDKLTSLWDNITDR